jgi:DNA primase
MPGRIPQSFIDDLINRIDIVEVIDAHVPLKKTGRDYSACCPFHNEKTPSFTVSQTKQFYHCFGCGAHGSAIGFLMDYDHLEFPEAVEELARIAGIPVPREAGSYQQKKQSGPDFYEILEQVNHFYQKQLREHPQASRAVDYLKNRGLSGEIAARFDIGYAPPGWDALTASLENASQKAAHDLGLLVERDNGGFYDRFRDRIMFPIRDRRGRVIGFGGRVLGDEKPKYMNSPESIVFHKGQELYGLFEARKHERALDSLLVVEGYMDVVALGQHGIQNTVATLGTATTAEHLERLYRVVSQVIFCFDGDNAGRKAAWRALENALPVMRQGREARFLFLPDGEDPDSMVRKEGKERFMERVEQSVPLSDYFYEGLKQRVDTRSSDGRIRLADMAQPLLLKLPDDLFRDMMLNKLAEITRMDSATIRERILSLDKRQHKPAQPLPKQEVGLSPVRTAIELLLHQPDLAVQVDLPARWQGLELAGIALLTELLEILQKNPNIQTGAILENWRDRPEEKHLAKLAATHVEITEVNTEFIDSLARLDEKWAVQRREFLLETLAAGTITEEQKSEFQELQKERHPKYTQGG